MGRDLVAEFETIIGSGTCSSLFVNVRCECGLYIDKACLRGLDGARPWEGATS